MDKVTYVRKGEMVYRLTNEAQVDAFVGSGWTVESTEQVRPIMKPEPIQRNNSRRSNVANPETPC